MYRKSILIVVALTTLMIFAACATAAPQAAQESEAESAPTEAPAEEAAPTEAPAEEAAEEVSEEGSEASDEGVSSEGGGAAVYTVDTEASTLEWYGEMPGPGRSENGTVQIADGQLSFDGSELVEGSFAIDMTTITPTSQSGNMLERLTGHLKSDEFFGVESYPTATLVIKSAEPTDAENQYTVVADLTIKETTDEIEFVTDVVVGDGTLEASADIVVDRAIYDVQYGSGSFFSDLGDDLISDEIELTVMLVAGSQTLGTSSA